MFNNQFIVITTVVHPILPRIFADPGLGRSSSQAFTNLEMYSANNTPTQDACAAS